MQELSHMKSCFKSARDRKVQRKMGCVLGDACVDKKVEVICNGKRRSSRNKLCQISRSQWRLAHHPSNWRDGCGYMRSLGTCRSRIQLWLKCSDRHSAIKTLSYTSLSCWDCDPFELRNRSEYGDEWLKASTRFAGIFLLLEWGIFSPKSAYPSSLHFQQYIHYKWMKKQLLPENVAWR